jgi:DNA polymerase eta
MNAGMPRVVAHVDLDAFYCAVERVRDPSLAGVPHGVSQYNPFEEGGVTNHRPEDNRRVDDGNGSLIAVSYEARALGVKRGMRGHEAKALAPALQIVQVPTSHGKADLSIYRAAGAQVLALLSRVADVAERCSIDEAAFDLTKSSAAALQTRPWRELVAAARGTHIAGVDKMPDALLPRRDVRNGTAPGSLDVGDLSAAWLDRPEELWTREERHLVAGAALLAEARETVRSQLGYTTSGGIAVNKLLAKLCSGLKKPASQTLLGPGMPTQMLLQDLPLSRLRGLGGELGHRVEGELGISTAGELAAVPHPRLCSLFGEETAGRIHDLARGQSDDPVKVREVTNSVQTSKTFRGQLALRALPDVHHWLRELACELEERLADDHAHSRRQPKLLTLSVSPKDGPHFSRSCQMSRLPPSAGPMADDAASLVRRWVGGLSGHGQWAIVGLGLGASNFEDEVAGMRSITDFLQARPTGEDAREQQHQQQQQQPSPGGLRRFFQPAGTSSGGDDAQERPAAVPCSRCGRFLKPGSESEHSDWHFAMDLSRREPAQEARPAAGEQQEAPKKRRAGPLDALFKRT